MHARNERNLWEFVVCRRRRMQLKGKKELLIFLQISAVCCVVVQFIIQAGKDHATASFNFAQNIF